MVSQDWRDDAACREEDPELFFPVGNSGPALMQIADAKAVCRRCPVVSECLAWALESGQDAGVWGGMSEDERRAQRRREQQKRGLRPKPAPRRRRSRVTAEQIAEVLRRADAGENNVQIALAVDILPESVRQVRLKAMVAA